MAEEVVGWSPPVSVEPVEFPLAVPLAEGAEVEDEGAKLIIGRVAIVRSCLRLRWSDR